MTLRIVREHAPGPTVPAQRLRIAQEPDSAVAARVRGRLWNLHSHSQYSHKDALPTVKDMVATVDGYGQPALGLTDHGNTAGSVQLYVECRKKGLLPFPGSEIYVVPDRADKKAKRHHMCVVAFTTEGYQNLVGLSTLSHRNFHNKPLIDHADLATLADQGLLAGIAATSGCYFSLTSQAVARGDEPAARALLSAYAGWFDRFYVELQDHGIDHAATGAEGWTDRRLANHLFDLATDLGLPMVVTQDAHYCEPTDKALHDSLKRMVSFGPDMDDAVFPGDGFHLADDAWFIKHHSAARLEAGAAGLADLLGSHDLKIKELDSYSYNIPFTVADPDTELSVRCQQRLSWLLETEQISVAHHERCLEAMADQLAVVRDTGMAGYLVLVAEVTDWCREHDVFYQARGSAAGSILCYLLQITNVDPIKWALRSERFISRDRTKPPDIDLDIEYHRRPDLISWLRTRFAVQQIGTWISYSLAGETYDGEDAKGSLRVAYFARKRATGQEVHDWSDVPPSEKAELYALDASDALSSYGKHPAGLVVTTNETDFDRLVPLAYVASSASFVTQYDMGDVETLGLVKLDVLGLKTLAVLNRAMTAMGRPVAEGLDWIPLRDPKTYQLISRGDTDGVFQLEGVAAKRGCRDLKPTKISDVIAAMALFRPATMDSGATRAYLDRKHKLEFAPERHPVIEHHVKDTHGVMLYQDQVVAILRDLGMDADELTDFLKAVKASQKDEMAKAERTIAAARERVAALSSAAGMGDHDFEWLWTAIEGFVTYGFNKAHSTVYGLTAYRCAYLSVHHPVEFFAGLLAVAAESGTKRGKVSAESIYVSTARARDIRILRPDVQVSGITYSVDRSGRLPAIRRGLVAIKSIGPKVATEIVAKRDEAGGRFTDIEHFAAVLRRPKSPITGLNDLVESGCTDFSVGKVNTLHEAGALASIPHECRGCG